MFPMQKIPLEAREEARFTPPALKDEETPPVFVLRAVSRRERGRFEDSLVEAGLLRVTDEDVRNEIIKALTELYGDDHAEHVDRIKLFWNALDDWNDAADEMTEEERTAREPFDHPDANDVAELEQRLYTIWKPLAALHARKVRFQREYPIMVMAATIKRWEGVDAPASMIDGWISPDAINDMGLKLIEQYGDKAYLAWVEIHLQCVGRIYVLPSAEKNSKSPPQSTPSQPDTTDMPAASMDGASPASETSPKTPAS